MLVGSSSTRTRRRRAVCACATAAALTFVASTSSAAVQVNPGHVAIPNYLQPHHRQLSSNRAFVPRAAHDDPEPSSSTSSSRPKSTPKDLANADPPRVGNSVADPSGNSTAGTGTTSSAAPGPTSVASDPSQGNGTFVWPQSFDSITTTSFATTTCPSFFQQFLNDPMVAAAPPSGCMPISLLMGTSNSFFVAERSPNTTLVTILDAACSPEPGDEACSAHMGALNSQLLGSCVKDLQAGNTFAHQARDAFRSYEVVRKATCAKNDGTGKYCFAEALARQDPSDLYFYLLTQGTGLPSGTNTSCSSCNRNLMQLYSQYASNGSLPLSAVYGSARNMAAVSCGPDFAPIVVLASSAARTATAVSAFLAGSVLASLSLWVIM